MGDTENSVSPSELIDAFEHAPLGMAITDERGQILHANRAFARMLGCGRAEIRGKSTADLTHPEDLRSWRASDERMRRGECDQFIVEKRYLHSDGGVVWVRVHASRMTYASRPHHLLHVADITHEKDADEALRTTEERFREMAAAIDQDFWMMSVEPLKLLYTSPAARRIWGFDPQDNREHPLRIIEHIHPEDADTFAELFGSVLHEAREREYRIVRPDGAVRWLRTRVFPLGDPNGTIRRITGVTEDVTVRKEAELEVARHRAFERLVLKLSTEFVNLPAERIHAGFEGALGELGAVIGAQRGTILLLDESDQTLAIRHEWRAAGSSAQPNVFSSFTFNTKNAVRSALLRDGVFAVESVESMPDSMREAREQLLANGVGAFIDVPLIANEKLIGLLGFGNARPTTWRSEVADLMKIAAEMFSNALQRVRSEDAMRAHREALAHVLRLGTMGQLATNIAHELNQPLAAILSYVQGSERRLAAVEGDPNGVHEALRKIGAQAVRAAKVIKALRAMVRKGGGRRSWHDINALVSTALGLVHAELADNGIKLISPDAERLPLVQVDPIQIEQVVLNLVRNAIDAVVRSAQRTPEVRVATTLGKPGTIEVSVMDNGSGVDAQSADFIFREFYTTKSDGLGLGLAISRSIIEAHGGHLWMDASSPDRTTFRFTLPAQPAA